MLRIHLMVVLMSNTATEFAALVPNTVCLTLGLMHFENTLIDDALFSRFLNCNNLDHDDIQNTFCMYISFKFTLINEN